MPNKRTTCCVPGCEQTINLHKFPHPVRDADRFRRWVFAIGGDIVGFNNEYIYQHRFVCHYHFDDYYLCRYNRISNIAIPTLNMPNFRNPTCTSISTRSPLLEMQNLLAQDSTASPCQDIQNLLPESSTSKESSRGTRVQTDSSSWKLPSSAEPPFPSNQSVETIGGADVLHKTPLKKTGKRIKMLKKERALLNKMTILKKKLDKTRSQSKKHLNSLRVAKNLMTNSAFLTATDNLTSAGKLLTRLQFRENKKKSKGRRFALKEKIIALSIFKQSPKAYRFLRKNFLLPAPQMLKTLLNRALIKPGIHEKIFDQLKTKADKMKMEEKLCILLFDEVSIQANLSYNERQDAIIGLATDGQETKKTFANHALVFMIRGLLKNYKQPVAYTFCSASTKGTELKNYIKEIIGKLQSAGFIVVATVCDQGSSNQKAIKDLVKETRVNMLRSGEELRKNMFKINNQEIFPLYDPPHLLKGVRNNLITKNLKYDQDGKKCVAKWSHIEWLYAENPAYKGIRLMPKLTENHAVPKKIGKMRVKFASQLFSQTVSSNVGYLADKGILPQECKDTADLLLQFDKLFDSMNGSYKKKGKHGKPYLCALTKNSIHHKLWKDSKNWLMSMKFINKKGQEERVPSIINWLWTIEGVENLIKKLNDDFNVNSLWTRHLNQDPLEIFFGSIRSQGCRNNNPSAAAFQSAFTTLMINNLSSVHAAGFNCEDDFCDALQGYIITEDSTTNQAIHELDMTHVMATTTPLEQKKNNVRIIAPLTYVAGYILRQCKKRVVGNCSNCRTLSNENQDSEYIQYREFTNKNWLCYPSDDMILIVSGIQDYFYTIIKDDFDKPHIKQYIKTVLMINIDFSCLTCNDHKSRLINFIIDCSVRFFLFNFCKDINRILSGRRKLDDPGNMLEKMAQEYYNKSLKVKKK